jgi:hypothetical protein
VGDAFVRVVERTVRRALDELGAPRVGWIGLDASAGKRHRYRILGPRAAPEAPAARRRTPDKLSGVNGAPRTVLPGTPDSFAGVGGHFDQGTPDILSAELDPGNKTQNLDPSTRRGEIVANSSSARATAAERVRAKMDAQAAWRAGRGER